MYERKIPINLDCGLVVTLSLIGGKWKPCLIKAIRDGRHRPVEMQREIPLANKRVLTQQLNALEKVGIVYKVVYPVLPAKVEYFLTDLGESLLPIIKMMDEWGQNHRHLLEKCDDL